MALMLVLSVFGAIYCGGVLCNLYNKTRSCNMCSYNKRA